MMIIVDIDHVLCDRSHRDVEIAQADWDEYNRLAINDKPIKPMIDLVNALSEDDHVVIGFSSRQERWRKLTNEWLLRHKVDLAELIMRRNDDYRPASLIKRELLNSPIVKDHGGIALYIDDREDICQDFSDLAVTTLQVRKR